MPSEFCPAARVGSSRQSEIVERPGKLSQLESRVATRSSAVGRVVHRAWAHWNENLEVSLHVAAHVYTKAPSMRKNGEHLPFIMERRPLWRWKSAILLAEYESASFT